MQAIDMLSLIDEIDSIMVAVRSAVANAHGIVSNLSKGLEDMEYESELRAFLSCEAKQIEMRMGRMDGRMSRATNLSCRFREQAHRRRSTELERLWGAARRVIRSCRVTSQLLSDDALFRSFDADGDGIIGEDDFLAFFKKASAAGTKHGANGALAVAMAAAESGTEEHCKVGGNGETGCNQDCSGQTPIEHHVSEGAATKAVMETGDAASLTPQALSAVFQYLIEGSGTAALPRETLLQLTHVYYKVIQETSLTSEMSLEETKTLRHLELGEVLEALEGPEKEPFAGCLRIRAKATTDTAEGWTTVMGNQGTVFLEEHFERLINKTRS